jgi:uncharacterized RDD family membrane protein YckC
MKTKKIQRDTLIWTEGLDNWTKAEHIALLKDILKATPPPIPNVENKTHTHQAPPPPIPEPQPTGQHFKYELASPGERFLGAIVQGLILIIFAAILEVNSYDRSTFIFLAIIIMPILGAFTYPIWSGNLGHKIMGLKVISSKDGTDINTSGIGAIREFLHHLMGIFILPRVWLLWDKDRQNIYDKLVNTYVVKKKQVR